MFDLYFFVLNRTAEQTPADLPGLLVVPPAKVGARGREGDLLVIQLAFNGPSPYLPPSERDVLKKIAAVYFKSPGPVTSGLRQAAGQLNTILLERNLRQSGEGMHAVASLCMAVLREDVLFIAQAGTTRTLILKSAEVQDNLDSPETSRWLGTATTPQLHYYQAALQVGDALVVSSNAPAAWNPTHLSGGAALTLEHLRRLLLTHANPDSTAVVFKFQNGSGQLHPLRLRPTGNVPLAVPQAQRESPTPTSLPAAQPLPALAVLPEAPQTPYSSAAIPEPEVKPAPSTPARSNLSPEPQLQASTARAAARRIQANQRRQKMAGAWLGWKSFRQKMTDGWKSFLSKLLPGRAGQPPSLSQAGMLFIAIAVPILVVVVAVTIYFQTGRTEQRQVYYKQAADYAAQAASQTDPILQRNNWLQTLHWLDKTESYGATEETRVLRRRAQQGVDGMDKIVRLDYLQVGSYAFSANVKITRILAGTVNDVYVLNGNTGSVSHLVLGPQGYDLDPNFTCGPAANNGPLVDIDLMPLGNPLRAAVIGLDNRGMVVYCIPNKPPTSAQLTPPTTGWGSPSRIRFNAFTLTILDVKANTVWRYTASKDFMFEAAPRSFFKDNHTLTLMDVVDMTIYNDDLFLLRNDGHIVKCTDSRVTNVPLRCTDPMKFEDRRPGRETFPTQLPETNFRQIISVEMPNPSLYILDASAPSIYQFSMALYLNEQYREQPYAKAQLPESTPTAFAIITNRQAYIAFGSRLYYAQIR